VGNVVVAKNIEIAKQAGAGRRLASAAGDFLVAKAATRPTPASA
jgi:hypothetical protein